MTDRVMKAPFMEEAVESCRYFWEAGWGENHAGNLSYLLSEDEVNTWLSQSNILNSIPIKFDTGGLSGKYFLVTRAGAFFRTIHKHPRKDLGIIRIDDGKLSVLWGFDEGRNRPTSEFPAHMLCHRARLQSDANNKLIMHCHPTHTIAMTFAHETEEQAFTKTMWSLNSECVLVFPEGLGMLPWMVGGEGEIGPATAKKMEQYRVVLWPYHGIFAAGKSFEDTIGLIETVEKNAQVYLLNGGKIQRGISEEQVRKLAEAFQLW